MARIPRNLTVRAGFAVHKVVRMHNKEKYLDSAFMKEQYLEFMNQDLESEKYENGSFPEAITIMRNHTHEISEVIDQKLFSNHFRRHHSRFGRFYNDIHDRSGKVAEDRPHTTLIGDDNHRMLCAFYVHANPHRAKIQDADRYEYSTHKLYAFGKHSLWMRNIRFPNWYLKLGRNMQARQRKYRKLFAAYLAEFGRFKQKSVKARFYGIQTWVTHNEALVTQWRKSRLPPAPS